MFSTLLLLAALVLSPVIGGGFGEMAGAVLQILVFAAIGTYLLIPKKKPGTWASVPALAALGVFLLAFLASVIASERLYASLNQLVFTLACLGAYALAATLSRDSRFAAAAVWCVVISALYVCVAGIRDYAIVTGGGANFWRHILTSGEHMRLFGSFFNPDFFAGYIVIALPITLGAYLVTRRTSLAFLAGVGVVIETLALMLTGAKFGIISAVAALLVFFVLAAVTKSLRKSKFTRLFALAIVLVPLLVIFSNPVRSRIVAAEAGGTQVHSTGFRKAAWNSTFKMIADKPWFGVGAGVYGVAYPRYALAGPTQYAHQSYLQIAAESGIIAFVAFIAAVFTIAFRSVAALVKRQSTTSAQARVIEEDAPGINWANLVPFGGWRLMCCAIFAGLAGSGVRNIADSDWYVIGIALPFWAMAGVLVTRSGAARKEGELRVIARIVLVVVSALAVLICVSFGAADMIAPDDLQTRGYPPTEMLRRYKLASRISPLNPVYHREYARYIAPADPDQADRQLDIAIRLSPTDASIYFLKGIVAMDLRRDTSSAASLFKRGLTFSPHSTQTILRLARLYAAEGDIKAQESCLRALLKIESSPYETLKGAPEIVDVTFAEAHFYFADKFTRQKNYRGAVDEYKLAADRLERWREKPEILEAQRITGRLNVDEERRVLKRLVDAYAGLSKAYAAMNDKKNTEDAEKQKAKVMSDIEKLD